jgi:hypothetical protein
MKTRLICLILLPVLFGVSIANAGTILLVSDNAFSGTGNTRSGDPELEFQAFLQGLGHTVIRATGSGSSAQFRGAGGPAAAAAAGADLIIISRCTDSGQYNFATAWNEIATPILSFAPHMARGGTGGGARWRWFNSEGIDQNNATSLLFALPDHPIVQGLATDIYNSPGSSLGRVNVSAAGNGTIVARAPDNDIAIVVWETGTEFYTGAGQFAGHRRVFFAGLRYHETNPDVTPNRPFVFGDYSENGKELIARAVTFAMTGAVGPVPPRIEDVSPTNRTRFHPANQGISFRVTSTGDPIPVGNISLVLNGVDMSANLNIGGTDLNRTVTFSNLEANVVYNAVITTSNARGVERTLEFQFDTIDVVDVVIIEAEDYNFEEDGDCDPPFQFSVEMGGGYIAQPFPGSYRNKLGSPGIDYSDSATTSGDPAINTYRHCDMVATPVSSDAKRQQYLAVGEEEYDVAQIVTGDWMNYTREFIPGNYRVYLRTLSAAPARIALSRVTGNRFFGNQSTMRLGTFEVAPTAGAYHYSPLLHAGTQEPLILAISAEDTFRLTALAGHSSLRLNYFVFTPTDEQPTLLGPMISSQSPAPGATDVRATAPITVSIINRVATAELSSIQLRVNGADVTGLAQITSENGSVNIRYLPAQGFAYGSTQTVNLSFQDNLGNPDSSEWSFAVRPTEIMVLLVLLNPAALNASDSGIKARLESLGYTVTTVADAASQTAHAVNKDMVIVSSTVGSGAVNVKFRDVPIPVINWEQALQDDFMMTIDSGDFRGTLGNQTSLNIVLPDHPLAAGLQAGTHVILTTPQTYSWGVPDENAAVIATLADNPARALIYAYEPGSSMIGNFVAPARRIHLFLEDNTFAALNEAGLRLFDAAVAYALQQDEDPIPPQFGATTLVDGQVQLNWTGTGRLQEAPEVTGTWTDVTPAPTGNSYSVPASGPRKFFRLVR